MFQCYIHTRLCPDLCMITCVFQHVPTRIGSVILAVADGNASKLRGAAGSSLFLMDRPPVMGLARDRALCSATEYVIVNILPFLYASKWQFESLLWLLEFYAPLFTLYMVSWWLQQSLRNLCTATCNNTCLPQTHNSRLYWALHTNVWAGVFMSM